MGEKTEWKIWGCLANKSYTKRFFSESIDNVFEKRLFAGERTLLMVFRLATPEKHGKEL